MLRHCFYPVFRIRFIFLFLQFSYCLFQQLSFVLLLFVILFVKTQIINAQFCTLFCWMIFHPKSPVFPLADFLSFHLFPLLLLFLGVILFKLMILICKYNFKEIRSHCTADTFRCWFNSFNIFVSFVNSVINFLAILFSNQMKIIIFAIILRPICALFLW